MYQQTVPGLETRWVSNGYPHCQSSQTCGGYNRYAIKWCAVYQSSNRLWVHALCVSYCHIMSNIQELTPLLQQLIASVSSHEQLFHTVGRNHLSINPANTDASADSDSDHVKVPANISAAQIREISNKANPSMIRKL